MQFINFKTILNKTKNQIMKKIFTLILCLVVAISVSAQLVPVSYRGAFAPAPTPMWTEGWTSFDPQNVVYPATTVTVIGNITTNTTWTKNNTYLLSGLVYIDSLVSLTIEPGTIIRGSSGNASLIVKRGAKLIAEGTPCNPIVFTSNQAVGNRVRGNWGGIVMLGRARNNQPGGVASIEGLTQAPANSHGGTDDADNSGILEYVRIEYAGFAFTDNNEINSLTMGSVGSGTRINHVQVSFANDDSFEWFGGTVNCSHLVVFRGLDDDFDTDFGYSGKVQFALAIKDPSVADNPLISTSEGFESDNDASGSTNTPQTSATFSNVTMIGAFRGNASASVATGHQRGARLRRNTGLKIFNSIFMDFASGVHIDGAAAVSNMNSGVLKFRNNIIAVAGTNQRVAHDANSRLLFSTPSYSNDSLSTTVGLLASPYDFINGDYRPTAAIVLTNTNFTDAALPVTLTSFYGVIVKNDNLLYWETATEINNAGFSVERSVDGINFSAIGYVASKAGNSSVASQYQFTDANAFDGTSYYRLKQVDKDGKFSFSSVVELTKNVTTSAIAASIYPNPVTDKLNVVIASPKAQFATLVVNDFYGRTLTTKSTMLQAGNNKFDFDVKQLATGQYVISLLLTDGSKATTQKFIKQ
jgi:hypothetical protein